MKINVTPSPQLPEYHDDATTKDNFALNLSYLNPRGTREEDPRKSSFKEQRPDSGGGDQRKRTVSFKRTRDVNAEDSYKNMVMGSMKMGLGVTPTILHVDSRNESFKT